MVCPHHADCQQLKPLAAAAHSKQLRSAAWAQASHALVLPLGHPVGIALVAAGVVVVAASAELVEDAGVVVVQPSGCSAQAEKASSGSLASYPDSSQPSLIALPP